MGYSQRVAIHSCAWVEKDAPVPTSSHLLLLLGLRSRCSGVGSQRVSVLDLAPWVLPRQPSLRPGMGLVRS